jgi:hypothetical protein
MVTRGLHFVRLVGHSKKKSKTTLEVAYGREENIQFFGNSSGGLLFSQHASVHQYHIE